NQVVEVVMIMTDPSKNYYDYQGFKFVVNTPAYANLDTNDFKTTITSIGRIGFNDYEDNPPTQGIGASYQTNALLYEAGFMLGASTSKVSDCVRANAGTGTYDNEFKSIQGARYLKPGLKDMEIYSLYNDSSAPVATVLGMQIEQRSYAWKNTTDNNFVILEYKITNKSSITYDSIFPGIFTDWDVYNYAYNRADWDSIHKMAYTYCTIGGTKVVGVSLLTNNIPSCFSMDQSSVGGNNINPNDPANGFTTLDKFTTLANGVYRKQAGMAGFGNDVSQVTGAKITNFAPGDVETVAFALIGADNIIALSDAAQTARDKFVSIHQGPVPIAPDVTICRKDTLNITFTPTNGNKFAFFSSPPPAAPLYVG
ncbi:MAG TPA: serine protease, partial [Bacteroidia bacterium]|nr:serine protease [Bacteroidia bacterium]